MVHDWCLFVDVPVYLLRCYPTCVRMCTRRYISLGLQPYPQKVVSPPKPTPTTLSGGGWSPRVYIYIYIHIHIILTHPEHLQQDTFGGLGYDSFDMNPLLQRRSRSSKRTARWPAGGSEPAKWPVVRTRCFALPSSNIHWTLVEKR